MIGKQKYPLIIEIFVTHKTEGNKKELLKKGNFLSLEIKLNFNNNLILDKESIQKEIGEALFTNINTFSLYSYFLTKSSEYLAAEKEYFEIYKQINNKNNTQNKNIIKTPKVFFEKPLDSEIIFNSIDSLKYEILKEAYDINKGVIDNSPLALKIIEGELSWDFKIYTDVSGAYILINKQKKYFKGAPYGMSIKNIFQDMVKKFEKLSLNFTNNTNKYE